MTLNLRRMSAILVSASLALVTSGGSVLAAAGSVTPSFTMTAQIQCNGTATVHLSIDGVSPPPAEVPVDVMLVLDRSGSLGGQPIADLRNAANSFVDTMDQGDGSLDGTITNSQVGMVSFASTPTLNAPLTHNANTVHSQINGLVASGTTDIGDAVHMATAQLSGGTAKDVMILMTDGVATVGTPDPVAAASAAKAAGIEVFTIGLGNGVNTAELTAMASSPSHYYAAPTSSQLAGIFQQIATGVAGPAATDLSYTVHAAAGWMVTGSSATKGFVTGTGSSIGWTLSELRTESVQIDYTLQHTGNMGGVQSPQDVAILTYTDSDGNVQTADYAGQTVDVQGCNQPPVANAGADQSVAQDNTGLATVTLDGSASTDDGQIAPLTYSWTEGATPLGSGVTLSYSFPLGSHTVTLKVNDGQYEASDDVTINVTDPFPPTTAASLAGTAGNNGWYTSPVTVSLSATDNVGGSGVQDTRISVDGGAFGLYTAPVTVSGDGTHTATYLSSDNAGNAEAPQQVTFHIDATAPTISVSSPAGQDYPDSTMLPITWTASDAVSGLASASATLDGAPVANGATINLSTALGQHTLVVTATDMAGNTTTVTVQFRVIVTYDSVRALKHRFYDMGLIKNQGIVTSLDQKLDAAQAAHNRGQYATEDNILAAFISEVNAQAGKGILEPAVTCLIRDAQWLQSHN